MNIARSLNLHTTGTVSEALSHIYTTTVQARAVTVAASAISEVTLFDICTLRAGEMISGEIIDAFSAILHQQFDNCAFAIPKAGAKHIIFSTYFFTKLRECDAGGQGDYTAMDRWTRKISIREFGKLIIPINVSRVHWILATITKPHGYSTGMTR